MPAVKHVHTYVAYKKRPGFFRCAAPDCTHFLDKESLVGKFSKCTTCGTTFVLSNEDLRRVRPKCVDCSNTKQAIKRRKIKELTRYIGTEAFPPSTTNLSEELDFYDKPIDYGTGLNEDEEGEELA